MNLMYIFCGVIIYLMAVHYYEKDGAPFLALAKAIGTFILFVIVFGLFL